MKKKFDNLIKFVKKNIVFLGVILLLIVLFIILYKYFNSNNYISIEISSTNVNYVYSPNKGTMLKIKQGDIVDLKIITDKSKSLLVKCYSESDIVSFVTTSSFKAEKTGETYIYCELMNNKSNRIEVTVNE